MSGNHSYFSIESLSCWYWKTVYAFPVRLLTFFVSFLFAGITLAMPLWLTEDAVNHDMISLGMLGMSAGFVVGVGYIPEFWLWRILFNPFSAWLLMGVVVLGVIF
ncbi:cyd operon YbgE family protein [Teredinibacter sp. KSP-S5-2]|uniref:cyd operon YbgE family protein n=1 Tax=Teredinibacter sp. KSP-S5-2 TaxID=3034506 RepID=UPI0029344651|nr:cyd operon YbgE family protein [Teredinibacter sp. KSP-S5-2]WNO10774.1 cyd operon YbgE family protein [Teredinibacter sp. KSP-S5-2]